jgi:hypothetical protein
MENRHLCPASAVTRIFVKSQGMKPVLVLPTIESLQVIHGS